MRDAYLSSVPSASLVFPVYMQDTTCYPVPVVEPVSDGSQEPAFIYNEVKLCFIGSFLPTDKEA